MIKGFEPRLYQQTILGTIIKKNTLVVLPTGLGKTFLFVMLADFRLRNFPQSKILLLAPTKPLAQQHMDTAKAHLELPKKQLTLLTGATPPSQRAKLWEESNLIFCTPQTIENDIVSGRISLQDVSLVCFDESHRAVGNYSYVWIADQYMKTARFPHVLGLTASPGSDIEKISEVCTNLHIEDIELRTYEDEDVKPFVKEIKLNMVEVELPERFKQVKKALETCFKSKLNQASLLIGKEFNIHVKMSKKDLLMLQRQLHSSLEEEDYSKMRAISLIAEALKVHHALELLETQGSFALQSYMSRLTSESKTTRVKAVKNLVMDKDFRAAIFLVDQLATEHIEHPKKARLLEIVDKETQKAPDSKMIIFNHYRDSAKRLETAVNQLPHAHAKLFVGQAKRGNTGLSQKQQKAMLDEFRAGEFNVLISTSIGEEGLDIPRVDLVIFYEPIPSAVRSIQRRGRTGRQAHGRVILLVTKGTRDVVYKWASIHKERRMYRLLDEIKRRLGPVQAAHSPAQSNLQGYMKNDAPSFRVIADTREKGSPVLKGLRELGASIELRQIATADYVCSKDCGIEYKTNEDFVDSILDRRLLLQAKRMRANFTKPLIIIQEGPARGRMVNKKAVYGAIAALALGFQIPILHVKSPQEAAELIYSIAKSEQEDDDSEFSMHFNKPLSLKEQQEYIVSALPGIGPKLARPLLKKFKSVKGIVNASEEALQQIPLIGKKKSHSIKEVFEGQYEA